MITSVIVYNGSTKTDAPTTASSIGKPMTEQTTTVASCT